jgi:hypothetical protein
MEWLNSGQVSRPEARPTWLLLALTILVTRLNAQYVGAAVCGSCHTKQFQLQTKSEHARALSPPAEHPLAEFFTQRAPSSGYEIVRTPEGFVARDLAGKETKALPLHWAFGAGDQAVTFVSQVDDDRYVEHRFSLYSELRGLALTPGHPATPSPAFPAAAGDVYQTFSPGAEIIRCFGCHSTGKLTLGPRMDIVPAELGVRCESCHGAGAAHVKAMQAGQAGAGRKAIRNPGQMTAEAMNEHCGDCHRKPARGVDATNWNDPWNTRHQPVYFAQSACFKKSNGAFSCLSCHDAHAPLKRGDAAFYNGKCASCHPQVAHTTVANAGNCISCHMPAVAPREHLRFANHWIGVYRPGQVLQPERRP